MKDLGENSIRKQIDTTLMQYKLYETQQQPSMLPNASMAISGNNMLSASSLNKNTFNPSINANHNPRPASNTAKSKKFKALIVYSNNDRVLKSIKIIKKVLALQLKLLFLR